jgi:hypothetical protein
MLIKAVHDSAVELARRGGQYLPTPMPDEPVIMASRSKVPRRGRTSTTKGQRRTRSAPSQGIISIQTSPTQMSFGSPTPSILLAESGMRAQAARPLRRKLAHGSIAITQALRTPGKTPVMKTCGRLVPKEMKHIEFEGKDPAGVVFKDLHRGRRP